jgi:hypothetical protein
VPDGKPVDRRQQFALGKVERSHHDRAGTRAAAMPGRCRAGATGGEQREQQEAGQSGHRTPARPPRLAVPSALGHGVTIPVVPACRARAVPLITAVPR